MDIRQLKYYCTLVEEKSYHKAAKKLYLSQPALSQQISLLEKELKAMLIKREGRRSLPTEVGLILYRKSKVILELSESTKTEVLNYNSNIVGSLRVATSCMPALLSDGVIEFYKSHPGIFLDIREGVHDTVMEWLQSGLCELAITDFEQYDSKDIKRHCIDTMEFMAVGTKKFIPDNIESISMKNLKNVPLIINRSDLHMIKSSCVPYNYDPKIVAYADSTESKINFASAGIGVCIGSESAGILGKEKGLNAVGIKGIDEKIERCIFWKDDYSLSIAASEFLTAVIENENYFDINK